MGGLTLSYVLRRFGMFLLTIWLGATLIFFIPRIGGGDHIHHQKRRRHRAAAHLDQSTAPSATPRPRGSLTAWHSCGRPGK